MKTLNLMLVAALVVASGAGAQAAVSSSLRAALQARAGAQYPLEDVTILPGDSAVIVFADSTYTGARRQAGTWMFGPPVPPIEQDSCPPEKILGRKIARVLWQNGGRESRLATVIVRVHGTVGVDRFSYTAMYYEPSQLEGPWAGDPARLPPRKIR